MQVSEIGKKRTNSYLKDGVALRVQQITLVNEHSKAGLTLGRYQL